MIEPIRNVIKFLEKTVISQIGQECFEKVFHERDIFNLHCRNIVLSKIISLAILLGGMMAKIPQIVVVFVNGSSEGISLVGVLIETSAMLITMSYNLRKLYPFTTFGEVVFLAIQNSFLVSLILYLSTSNRHRKMGRVISFVKVLLWNVVFVFSGLYLVYEVDGDLLSKLQDITIGLVMASKVPQIVSNYMAKSTGNLSSLTVLMILGGSCARMFTTLSEIGDPRVILSCTVSVSLNAILMLQLIAYRGTRTVKKKTE